MKTKRVLVTGASGFVGRPLVAALQRAGYAVRAMTRRQVTFPEGIETVIVGDLAALTDWSEPLQGVDIVIHLANLAHSPTSDDSDFEFDKINWMGTNQLAKASKNVAVERFVFVSSVRAQAGPSAAGVLSEIDEPRPTNNYGRSKLAAEQAVRVAGVPFTIFRPVVIYGPNPKGNIRTLIKLAQSPLPMPRLKSRRSMLGIDNFTSAIIFALNNPATIGETYLLADSRPMTIGEILKVLRKQQRRPLTTIYIPRVVIRGLLALSGRKEFWSRIAEDLVVDTAKFESLGWRPSKDTAEGLREMIHRDDLHATS